MAKPKYEKWLTDEGIAQITNWAAKGLTYAELAKNMGVAMSTFCLWRDNHSEISEAIKKGRSLNVVSLENMAFKVAMGEVFEETLVKLKDSDGNERVESKKRKLAPSVPMLIFLLKNRAGYSDNPSATEKEAQQVPVFIFDQSVYGNAASEN